MIKYALAVSLIGLAATSTAAWAADASRSPSASFPTAAPWKR